MSLKTPVTQARFLPGTMVGDRWRIVSPLGQGGMGEVYRADDLKLGEVVALKFLPERLEQDGTLRERFLSEARLARQVAHPNVCRMYDIGEVGGRPFLSMEFVDGEDLGSLLTRIGRLPHDKAVQIAREICAGLQAAHELGILHRDLKPSNVMIDGRGRARLTDFGLAALVEGANEQDPMAGTPVYMAPEQLAGKPPSVASDVYALGLVLYELFTGRKAFEAASWAEQAYLKQNSTPSQPSQVVPEIDPATERAILRCLALEPLERPRSAAGVAAALPGGDPLAAALAAGETPSPELVAEGAGDAPLDRRAAWMWLAACAVGLLLCVTYLPTRQLLTIARLEKPPAVLLDRARELAAQFGYAGFHDEYARLYYTGQRTRAVLGRLGVRDVAQAADSLGLLAGSFYLRYQASHGVFRPRDPHAWSPGPADVVEGAGDVDLTVNGRGDLGTFIGVPPPMDSMWAKIEAPWPAALQEMNLSSEFSVIPDSAILVPGRFADERRAFLLRSGTATGLGDLRLSMAVFRGRLVEIVLWPADMTGIPGLDGLSGALRPIPPVVSVIGLTGLALLLFVMFLAWRHIRMRQADLTAATRVAIAFAGLALVAGLLTAHWNEGLFTPVRLFGIAMSTVAPNMALALIFYAAFEPILRRTWPHIMVSWLRLLQGRFMDPRVGSDVLRGAALALISVPLLYVLQHVWAHFSGTLIMPGSLDNPGEQTDTLMGGAWPWAQVLASADTALINTLFFAATLSAATALVRRRVVGVILGGLAVVVPSLASGAPITPFDITSVVLTASLFVFGSLRWGLVSGLVFLFVRVLLAVFPMEHPGASWYWPVTLVGLVALAALSLWGFRAALGKRAMFAFDSPASAAGAAPTSSSGSTR